MKNVRSWFRLAVAAPAVAVLLFAANDGLPGSHTARAQPEDADWEQALGAALTQYGAIRTNDGESCGENNPEGRPCISATRSPAAVESARRGIFTFSMGDAAGLGGAHYAFGRDSAGAWRPWLGFQNTIYQLLTLPGEMRVCAGGDALNVRGNASLDAPVIGSLSDGAVVTVDGFVLSAARSAEHQGEGWYHVTGPVEGWAFSRYLSNALLADCTIQEIQIGE